MGPDFTNFVYAGALIWIAIVAVGMLAGTLLAVLSMRKRRTLEDAARAMQG
jgi:hypothetical protein